MTKQFTTSTFVFKEIKNNEWEVLLIHHRKFDKWMVPGGHIENFENPIEGARREVLEETGIEIKFISFLHEKLSVLDANWILPPEFFYEQLIPETKKEKSHYHIDLAYLAICQNENIKINIKETKDVKWVKLQKALDMNIFDGTKKILINSKNKLKNNKIKYYEKQPN